METFFHAGKVTCRCRILTTNCPRAITCLGVRSVYMARVAASCVREAVWLWRSNRYVRLLKFLRISGPYAHHHHHKNHQILSTSWRPLIDSVLFPGQKFQQCTPPSLYQHPSV